MKNHIYTFVGVVFSNCNLYDETIILKVSASAFAQAERIARKEAESKIASFQYVIIDTSQEVYCS